MIFSPRSLRRYHRLADTLLRRPARPWRCYATPCRCAIAGTAGPGQGRQITPGSSPADSQLTSFYKAAARYESANFPTHARYCVPFKLLEGLSGRGPYGLPGGLLKNAHCFLVSTTNSSITERKCRNQSGTKARVGHQPASTDPGSK